MKTNEFQLLLLRASVVAMAVDGDIAEEEKQELARIVGSSAYFLGFSHETLLPQLLTDDANHGSGAAGTLAQIIREGNLKPRQEEVLIEVLLCIIEADAVVQPAERDLLRTLRSAWQLSDGVLMTRFPRLLTYLLPASDDPLHV